MQQRRSSPKQSTRSVRRAEVILIPAIPTLGSFVNPVIVLWVELVKLAFSAFVVYRKNITIQWHKSYLFFVLTFIYYTNNNLYLTTFKYASAPAIQLLLYVKIPATVLLHHFLIKKQSRSYPWLLLSSLMLGALISQLTDKFEVTNSTVIVICMVLSMNSAMASIYNEKLLKSLDMNFWSQQVITYSLTAMWSLLHLTLTTSLPATFHAVIKLDSTVLSLMMIIAILSGFSGITTGMIIKQMDTIARLLAGIVVSMIVTIGVFFIFSKSPNSWLFFTVGSIIIGISVYLYGIDVKENMMYNSILEGRTTSLRRILVILLLSIPVSLVALYKA